MATLILHILPVYSAYHPSRLIAGMRLLQHQAETLDAFHDPDVDVIFNCAMTGDGKSLAAYAPAFLQQQQVVAMYPTNELVRDQYGALASYQHHLNIHVSAYDTMYSEKITQLMRFHDESTRLEEVSKLLERNDILLTNPDLIHLMMSHQYGWGHMRKELPVAVGMLFDYFLFDEAHVFRSPQVISILNMLGYLAANYREKPLDRKKFLFLSATPSKLFDHLLARSGLRCRNIEGHYCSSASTDKYRRILQPCTIELHEISQQATIEQWVEAHLREILEFFQHYPGSKAALLVSSPATARRLVERLRAYFAPHGITIGENTGLTSLKEREEAFQHHILVGTSTVDIGIDFHINYLIFEAFESGSFLQRFGRLGRHDEFLTYQAHALIPRFVLERFMKHFTSEQEVERARFNEIVCEAFPTEQEFATYPRLWGVVQAAHVVAELQNQSKKDANQAFTDALVMCYEQIYGMPEKPALPRALRKYRRLSNEYPQILKDLLSFRGQSLLDCGAWDTSNKDIFPQGQFLTYHLFFLLVNTNFQVLLEEDFLQKVRAEGHDERNFREKLLYLQILSYVPTPQKLVLGLHYNLTDAKNSHTLDHVQVLQTFFVREPRSHDLDQVNAKLKRLKLTCLISAIPRQELKLWQKLSILFPVYRLEDRIGGEYSVVFGQDALLLDSVLFFHKPKNNRALMA